MVRARNVFSLKSNGFLFDNISTVYDNVFNNLTPLEWLQVHERYYTRQCIFSKNVVQ